MNKSAITVTENIFQLDTPGTSYVFRIAETGHLEQLYYGKKIRPVSDAEPLKEKTGTGLGTTVFYSAESAPLSLNNFPQEISTAGKGDFREPFLLVRGQNGAFVNDFLFESYEILENFGPDGLPSAHGKAKTLAVTVADRAAGLYLNLYYSVFDDCDIIVKSASLTNKSGKSVRIEKLASSQLDLPDCAYDLVTLDGAWAKERYVNSRPLSTGIFTVDSKVGFSSNTHNPFIMLKRRGATPSHGDCYGFNLVYSGNHCESVEVTTHEKTRVINGINPFGFSWELKTGETFFTPEAVLGFSPLGTNGLTHEFHNFVNRHIVRGAWAGKERPILINNWEATMFNFTEEKLLAIASKGKEIGAELFVLDDGWFGSRTDDKKGLGDWFANKERFPDGLNGFAEKIKALGLMFGVWVEPEMVNPDSGLYRAHPDWAVAHPSYTPSLSRNQLLLDLCNKEVRQYIIEIMTEVFSSADISYVKWDFNRPMSDFYSGVSANQGEFFHRYTLGLYEILGELTKRFPDVLFESCASGGSRFDLGMLCYMPQIWASDNTDSYDRALIQAGTLLAYPLSTMGAHVSGAPNAQTLRRSTIDNRFNTACFGLLGYELDLAKLNPHETAAVKAQVEFYKKYRKTIQYGDYYVIKDIFTERTGQTAVISPDKKQALTVLTNNIAVTSPPSDVLRFMGLKESARYAVETRQQAIPAKDFGELIFIAMPQLAANPEFLKIIESGFLLPLEKESYSAFGDLLMNAGIKLSQQFSSSGYTPATRIMLDFGSRIYTAEMIEN